MVASVRAAQARRLHRALAGALGRLARRLGRLDVRRARPGAVGQRRLRRRRADPHRARRALAVVPRDRVDDRRARPAADRPARARRAARARRKIAVAAGLGAVGRARSRGSPRSRSARRTRCSCRSASSSTATSRRWRRRASGRRSSTMTLGFALVLALVYLAWLLDRVAFLVPALVPLAALRGRALALGARRGRPGLVVEDGARRLGAHLRRVALDRRARDDGRAALVRRAAAAPAGVPALLAARDGADRARPRRGDLPQHRAAAAPARSLDRSATARCCS